MLRSASFIQKIPKNSSETQNPHTPHTCPMPGVNGRTTISTNCEPEPETEPDEEPALRLLKIPRAAPKIEEYGFRLTRSKWDPYPWVSDVAAGTPASLCGLRTGDCILKVNGIDIIGMRIAKIAQIVKSQEDAVTFLCWSSDCKNDCDNNSICCEPMPTNLRRLVSIVESILKVIECPVCNVSIAPPVLQCQNGHLLCLDCRVRSQRCPICRGFFTPIRSAVAEDIYSIIAHSFKHCQSEGKLRNRIFGGEKAKTIIDKDAPEMLKQRKATNRFFSKLLQSKVVATESAGNSGNSQENAAKLLSVQRPQMTSLESLNEKRLQPGLTRTSMLNCTNELQGMSVEERHTKAIANREVDSSALAQETDIVLAKSRQEEKEKLHCLPQVATSPSAVTHELRALTEPPDKAALFSSSTHHVKIHDIVART